MLRAQRREQKKRNARKMKVHGKSVFRLKELVFEKEEKLRNGQKEISKSD